MSDREREPAPVKEPPAPVLPDEKREPNPDENREPPLKTGGFDRYAIEIVIAAGSDRPRSFFGRIGANGPN